MKIQIIGTTNEGKTTIATYIQKKLEEIGVESIILDDDPKLEISPMAMFKRLNYMQNRPSGLNITIKTVRAIKESLEK